MIRLRGSLTPLSASVFKVKNLGAGRIPRSRGCLGNPTYHKYPRPPVFIPGNLAFANFRAETVRSETVADIVNRPSTYMGVGEYKLTIQVDDGKKVVREFEVYFDNEKTVPILGKMLAKDNDIGERNWAIAYLSRFNRPKLVSLLEDLARAGNDRQRQFATQTLAGIKAHR